MTAATATHISAAAFTSGSKADVQSLAHRWRLTRVISQYLTAGRIGWCHNYHRLPSNQTYNSFGVDALVLSLAYHQPDLVITGGVTASE